MDTILLPYLCVGLKRGKEGIREKEQNKKWEKSVKERGLTEIDIRIHYPKCQSLHKWIREYQQQG